MNADDASTSPPAALPAEIFRLVVEHSDAAISITDREANILYANPAFSRITGYPPDEILGRNEAMLSAHKTPRSVYADLWQTIRAGRSWRGELENRRRDGSEYLADITISPVFDANGQLTHYLAMHRDITLHRMEEQRSRMVALQGLLAEEERNTALREGLLATLFRLEEPMNVLASAVRLLSLRNGETATAALRQALADGRRILDELRDSVPLEEAEAAVPVNINEAIHDVLSVSTAKLLKAGIEVDWRPVASLPPLLGRPIELRCLFKALIDNAIEAMDAPGRRCRELRLTTKLEDELLVVEIADSGPGIPPQQHLRVFEPFFTTKRGHGQRHLGTGLSRAQQTAGAHGGCLLLDCPPGGGCLARVEFPLDHTLE